MNKKPTLSFWQIWNMCFGFLGIQFGFALQNANVSRIFQTLGASIDDIPLLWIAAPVTGLVVQPIIGYLSDKTWNRLGRRRPYFLYGAIAASIALLFMPHSPTLWIAAGMLWIMDASINVAMEPFRAFVGDMLPEEQRTRGFTMQSFFIGIGAVVASALPWMMTNWLAVSNTAPEGIVPDSVIYAFSLGALVFFLAVLWTVLKTREYSPEQLAAFEQYRAASRDAYSAAKPLPTNTQWLRGGALWILIGVGFALLVHWRGWDAQLHILAAMVSAFGLMQLITGSLQLQGRVQNGFYQVTCDLFRMPRTMKQLAVVQFFSWFALFSMWIYTTAGVTAHHYGSSDTASALYNQGADWVGVLFAAYNGFAALAAFVIPVLARRFNRKIAHIVCLCLGGLGLASFVIVKDPVWLLLSMVGVGFAWASILSVPYAILSCALPAHKMGVYMGIFNFFIVIPQILAASVLGLIMRGLFDNQAIYALVCGGAFMLLSAIATLWVDDRD